MTQSTDPLVFYAGIGRMTIAWAHIENALDHIINLIFEDLNGNEITDRPPQPLSGKFEFMKKAVTRIPALEPIKDDFLDLVDRLTKASVSRHDMIHGIIESDFEKNEVRIRRRLFKERTHRHVSLTVEQVLDKVTEAERLTDEAYDSAVAMATHLAEIVRNMLNQPSGNI
jgi:hypothetical protein